MLRREACCSTLTFVARLFDPDVLARCTPDIAQQARARSLQAASALPLRLGKPSLTCAWC